MVSVCVCLNLKRHTFYCLRESFCEPKMSKIDSVIRRLSDAVRWFCAPMLPPAWTHIYVACTTHTEHSTEQRRRFLIFFPLSNSFWCSFCCRSRKKIANKAIRICEWHLFHPSVPFVPDSCADPDENYTPSERRRRRWNHMCVGELERANGVERRRENWKRIKS